MVANFAQLDQNVFVVGDRVSLLNHALLEQVSVDFLLLLCDADLDMNLDFRRQSLLDFLLDPTQQERLKDPVQLLNDLFIPFLFLGFTDVLVCAATKVEPFIEVVRGRENLRK